MRGKAALFCAFVLSATCAAFAAGAGERLALVIGNSGYKHAPFLPNASQDARDVARALRDLGFDVYDGYDLTRIDTLRLVSDVATRLTEEDVALFYFSGHGIQIGAENFILPVDAAGADEAGLKASSVSLQSVLREMELRAGRNIVILDACRNNPFEVAAAARSIGGPTRGLARVDAGVGSYIAFSTQPGNVALDGSGRNSPFTEALVRHMSSAGDDLHEVMRKVRADVVEATGGQQVPWENSSLIEQVFLSEPGGRPAGATAPATAPAVQVAPAAAADAAFTHAVSGLDPNGDGFLALRSGTTSSARRLAKMPEGTRLAVLDQQGVWFRVRTEAGLDGWAHSNWIRFVGAASRPPTAAPAGQDQCDALWLERNGYFARRGYCFQGARGRAAFSNEGCIAGMSADDTPLSASERREVARIAELERRLGCP